MIESFEQIKPFNYLDSCGDFSIVKETPEYYFCAIGDIGGHGNSTVFNIANDIKEFILERLDLELDEILALVHSQNILNHHGMTLGLIKIFKHSSLISYIGVGNIKAMIVKSSGAIINFKFQDGIVGYTIPHTIVTNILKVDKLDTIILNTDGVSIVQKDINLNLLRKDIKDIASELIKKYAKDDDDSLCLVVKYLGSTESLLPKTINITDDKVAKKNIYLPKTDNLKYRYNIEPKYAKKTMHKLLILEDKHKLITILDNDTKMKDKLYKILTYFELDKKTVIKTSLFFLELQQNESYKIDIFYYDQTIQISMRTSHNYRDIISCLFQHYIVDDTKLTIQLIANNFIYDITRFNNFKELLKFGLDEEAMLLNKKLQEEVDKKLEELFEKEQLNEKLSNKAYTDNLTGAYNRHKFEDVFKYEFEQFKRYKNHFSIAMIDIDYFKKFNDKYGHLIGDEVLIMLADEAKKTIRTTDTFARWGGEEFLVLFSGTTAKETVSAANKLRENILALQHPVAGNVTASFGVSQIKESDTLDDILKRCDDALYKAKDMGRNRVEIKY